jgi:hypothetical protein
MAMTNDVQQDEGVVIVDESLGVSYAMAELELLRAETTLIEVQIASHAPPPEPTTHDDLSPLGRHGALGTFDL